jgi:hypothetical protein
VKGAGASGWRDRRHEADKNSECAVKMANQLDRDESMEN